MSTNSTRSRAGFTLIEILVTIAIIAILVSLLVVGVMKVIGTGPEAQNRNDILQSSTALTNFKNKYKFYPPSQIKLCDPNVASTEAQACPDTCK